MTDEKFAMLSLAMRLTQEAEAMRESLRYQGRGEPLTSLALAAATVLKDAAND